MRVGDTVAAVAASSLSRTAIQHRPIPVRRSRDTTTATTASEPRHRKKKLRREAPKSISNGPSPTTGGFGGRGVEVPPVKKSWVSSHDAEATAKARVVTARNRPRTRRAGRPTSTAAATPIPVATATAAPHGSDSDRSNRSKGTGMSWPRVSPTTVMPPSPTKAYWPSESCPAQPVSTDSDRATMANSTMPVQANRALLDDSQSPRAASRAKRAASPRASMRRAHHGEPAAAVAAVRDRGDSDQPPSARPPRTASSTATSTTANR